MFKFGWLTVLIWLPIAASPSFAADPAPVVGTWKLASLEREYQASSEREYPMGKIPAGYILFLPEGRMAVVITGEGRKAPTSDQDRAGPFNTLVAYTGRYLVDGDKWISAVDVSANPAWAGTEQTRSFRITGDQLQEMTALGGLSRRSDGAGRPDLSAGEVARRMWRYDTGHRRRRCPGQAVPCNRVGTI